MQSKNFAYIKIPMKIRLTYIVTIFMIFIDLSAQSSIHLRDKLSHKISIKKTSQNDLSFITGANSLTKAVFGFLPYWELYNENLTIRYDLLTHLAVFDFLLENDGSVSFPPEWEVEKQFAKWSTIISSAKLNDVKVIMTISNLSLTDTDSILVSNLINKQSVKNNFFSDVKTIISDYNFDGINLDFENPKLSERGDPINNFTQEFRDSLDTWFTGKELSFATPAVNWGNRWKLKELSEICNYLFIMAYDYHGSWSTTAGPVAPLTGGNYNYHTIIEDYYAEVNPDKLILGVPYYGAQWRTDDTDPYTDVIPKGQTNSDWFGNINYNEINWNEVGDFFVHDDISQSTYLLTQVNDGYSLTWIDNEYSLSLKYDFALEKNLRGVGMWSLGKDGNYPELWNLIEDKFADTTTAVEDDDLAKDFILYQNYPNPFNPTTSIEYQVSRREIVTLTVYNTLGQQVETLVDEQKSPGVYEVQFDASNLSSGVYFYTLTAGEFSATNKLLLLK